MLKRVVSSVVSVACLLSATGAFAATNYEATKTEYYSNDRIKVTSTISGASGDTATYLVYDKSVTDVSGITGTNIVYVDQYEFDGTETDGKWTFSYVTANSDIGATIKVGNGATSDTTAPTAIPGISYPITVKCENSEWTTTGTTDADETGWVKIPFGTTQSLVKSVSLNGETLEESSWFTGANALWIKETLDATSNEFAVEVQEAASNVKMNGMTYIAGEATKNPDGYTEPSIVAVATVTGSSDNVGIILTQDTSKISSFVATWNGENDTSATNTENQIGAFPALGVNSQGQFAIRIYDANTFTPGSVWYAVAYYNTENSTISWDMNAMKITIPGGNN